MSADMRVDAGLLARALENPFKTSVALEAPLVLQTVPQFGPQGSKKCVAAGACRTAETHSVKHELRLSLGMQAWNVFSQRLRRRSMSEEPGSSARRTPRFECAPLSSLSMQYLCPAALVFGIWKDADSASRA